MGRHGPDGPNGLWHVSADAAAADDATADATAADDAATADAAPRQNMRLQVEA